MQENRYLQEDEIDLRELFFTIWEKKVFIILFTLVVTLAAVIYVLLKNPTPIYEGKIYLEIGKIQDKNFVPTPIETPNDLSNIISVIFAKEDEKIENKNLGLKSQLMKGSTKVLEISFSDFDTNIIKNELEKIKDFIIEKHQNETTFYENVLMTKQIGEIKISDTPINQPKKKLIVAVAFVTGFILSIFLVFFLKFIKKD
ncbi:Wzz/FepE/Etk N-terminal domain-containing protein [Aliarcobacter skirrowii]|uniref:Polysaccharide chain length determinant N-terminal domain-containing protein n=1 Tax=Aliarcobacter skirrowii TaxID=28200 RepID=A0A2U2C2H2_9BACT|nr:Wzz/FepE/Etk N-terminal domain-containing protein [Aliarcobacter skirrowii]PWE22890.1 hypothetical protein DGF29_02225 [Aliarcobacter skirrowii]PWE23234.1 hypothetical protein DF188_00745 [Aliarcobacter skirrowii]PWE26126.1 hypothetical protein DGE88_02065 [Aliarcobacter skirrowii]RJO56460.1 hypothetical protein DIR39_00785 [Aliarcobacter skirrowii]RJO58415.1 hypothetical protein DIR38_00785 [Aliarcobacter skirrowii]